MEDLQEIKGLLALLRQVQLEDQPAVPLPLQLQLRVGELGVQVLDIRRHVVVQGNVALLHLVVDEEEHIQQGHP